MIKIHAVTWCRDHSLGAELFKAMTSQLKSKQQGDDEPYALQLIPRREEILV